MYLSITKQQYHINTQEYKKMQKQNLTIPCLHVIKKSEKNKDDPTSIIITAIEESFSSLINSEYNIFMQLQPYGITKANIKNNIKKFTKIIENQFGLGAKLIEIKIIQLIHQKIQNISYTPKNHDLFFDEYLSAIFQSQKQN
jgi:hypothetical protein